MSGMRIFQLNHAEKIQEHAQWECGEHDEFSQEHIEKCLNKMLSAYVDDDRNYVVDYAEIECSDSCSYKHCIRYKNGKTRLYDLIKEDGGGSVERNYIPAGKQEGEIYYFGDGEELMKMQKLHALHAIEASANGIRFATVADNICLRDVEEGIKKIDMPEDGLPITCKANIVSMGNCRIMRESDIPEIEKRLEESIKYGTCYSLIKPAGEWVNPICTEDVTGKCYEEDVGDEDIIRSSCTTPRHHKTMKFDTKYGQKEGLTMLSTLLCTRGGVITIKVHGQIYLDRIIEDNIEDRIQELMDSIEGKPVSSFDEICKLPTVDILARLIYQEDRDMNEGQNAVAFSIINRLFSETIFTMGTKSNSIYSVITGSGQYDSLIHESDYKPNSFCPPISEDEISEINLQAEKEAWENAKRLAAVMVIAIEEYGNENKGELKDNDRRENTVIKGDLETRQQVVDFMEQLEDMNGQPIKNEIDTRDSLRSQSGYKGQGHGKINKGGNTFFWL